MVKAEGSGFESKWMMEMSVEYCFNKFGCEIKRMSVSRGDFEKEKGLF